MGRVVRGLLAVGALGCVEAVLPLPPVELPPSVLEPVPEAPQPAVATHTVRPGDTLWVLARRFGVSTRALAERNGIDDPRRLQIGSVLVIPASLTPAAVRDVAPSVPAEPRREPAPDTRSREQAPEAPSAAEAERADAILAEVEDDYRRADFQAVLERVPELDRLLDSLPAHPEVRRRQARVAFVAGASLAGLGRNEEAVASFERAYQADPDLAIDPALTSPRLAELLDAARAR